MPPRGTRKRTYCYDYARPMVTTDCVLFRIREKRLETLLVRRGRPPYKGGWALPGGFIKMKEPLEEAAARELAEETGIRDVPFLIQLGAYGDPKRDPRGRVVGVAYVGILPEGGAEPQAGSDAAEAAWHPVESLPAKLCFDHPVIIGDALRRLAAGGRTSGVLFAFLPERFTPAGLADALEAVYGIGIDPAEYLAPFLESGLAKRTRGKKYRFTGRIG